MTLFRIDLYCMYWTQKQRGLWSKQLHNWHGLFIPDGFFTLVWILRTDDANQSSCLGVLLHLHDGALCGLKGGRLVDVRNADSHNGLVSEGTQVHKAWVYVLVNGLHHNVVRALALKVQWLTRKKKIKQKQKTEGEKKTLNFSGILLCDDINTMELVYLRALLMNENRLLHNSFTPLSHSLSLWISEQRVHPRPCLS